MSILTHFCMLEQIEWEAVDHAAHVELHGGKGHLDIFFTALSRGNNLLSSHESWKFCFEAMSIVINEKRQRLYNK